MKSAFFCVAQTLYIAQVTLQLTNGTTDPVTLEMVMCYLLEYICLCKLVFSWHDIQKLVMDVEFLKKLLKDTLNN